jgi:hypothetical protein
MDLRLMNGAAVVLLAVFLGSVALAAARWVSNRSAFSLQSITVQGDVGHANVPTVRAHVVSRVAGTFFSVDLARTRSVLPSCENDTSPRFTVVPLTPPALAAALASPLTASVTDSANSAADSDRLAQLVVRWADRLWSCVMGGCVPAKACSNNTAHQP